MVVNTRREALNLSFTERSGSRIPRCSFAVGGKSII